MFLHLPTIVLDVGLTALALADALGEYLELINHAMLRQNLTQAQAEQALCEFLSPHEYRTRSRVVYDDFNAFLDDLYPRRQPQPPQPPPSRRADDDFLELSFHAGIPRLQERILQGDFDEIIRRLLGTHTRELSSLVRYLQNQNQGNDRRVVTRILAVLGERDAQERLRNEQLLPPPTR